jgi:hypothetical protein
MLIEETKHLPEGECLLGRYINFRVSLGKILPPLGEGCATHTLGTTSRSLVIIDNLRNVPVTFQQALSW